MKFAPKEFLRQAARKEGLDSKKVDSAMNLFKDAKRIDIQPLPSRSGRGFIITIDSKLSLFFYQNKDAFYFDGIEMGKYKKGDVSVFDKLDL
jgi:hypothetical protein|tara:strand:+ start:6739 stop:7014 length:276 start_codon:yes stop_codon:yes gene_type:complete